VNDPIWVDASRETTVSVIVPVRDRRDMLRQLLAGLDRQTYRSFEVIVIDDGSLDGSGDLARTSSVAGRPVRVIASPRHGALFARQAGVEASVGSVLAFIDSDCIPEPGWLEHALTALSDDADVVNGNTSPLRPPRPLERSLESGAEGLYPTCNMFYRREVYDRLGGFDADAAARWRFRLTRGARDTGFGEDTLLAWQAVRSGATVRYVPDAAVKHQVFPPDWKELMSRTAQVAAFPAMTKEIPELRGTLMRHRIFLGDCSRVPMYATAFFLALRQRPLAGAAFGWWVAWRLRRLRQSSHSTATLLPLLPAEMAIDVTMAGALLVGSIRAGSLVL
jgi:cellulose synthase/poly-beta-1,6-N-acetylglucosamine synthase-like glycosyltransferase